MQVFVDIMVPIAAKLFALGFTQHEKVKVARKIERNSKELLLSDTEDF